MKKFDIFIKGINPERVAETETIKVNAAKVLQISVADFDELLAPPNGACIRREANEDEAKHYQLTLTKLGLVCLYRPAVQFSNLELLPIETDAEPDTDTLICPNCEHEILADEEGNKPEKCTKCGIIIVAFIEQKQRNEERDAIKAKLLASQTILKKEQSKKQQEDAERQRKLDLEKEVLEELHKDGVIKKSINIKLVAIGFGLCVIALGINYFFIPQENSPSPSTPTITPESAKNNTEFPPVSNSTLNAPDNAQQAMQKTHDQAAQVLNGFGLDPDAFANAGNSNTNVTLPSAQTEIVPSQSTATIPVSNTASYNAVTKPTITTEKNIVMPGVAESVDLNEISTVLSDDITWDAFLAQNSKTLLERQLPENAASLGKYMLATDVYVDTLGVLLQAAQQHKQTKLVDDFLIALENRLNPLPAEQQAVYFAQAGGYLTLENGSNALLARTEKLLAGLPKPELQLNAVLKLAVIYSKTGNISIANSYFNKINTLLAPVTDPDMQVQLRIAVAHAYQEVNNTPVAVQWLNSTEPQMKQLKTDTLNALMMGYAQCNQWQTALEVLTQNDLKTSHDLWLYQAIIASLKAGFIQNALELHKSLHAPLYKTLAAILIADYSPTVANELLVSSEQFLNGQATSTEKIIIGSRLVEHYGRLKNTLKTEALMAQVKNILDTLSPSPEKDTLLHIVIMQYSRGFQNQVANDLLTAIQSSALKTRLNVEMNQLADVGKLLK